MTATTAAPPIPVRSGSVASRLRGGLLAAWAGITGAAPHVLHHVGPLAGSALVAGVGGRVAFGAVGLVATIPTLRRLRRRTGSWRTPALALVASAAVFTFSTLVIGPALMNTGTSDTSSGVPTDSVDHHGHDGTGDGAP